MFRLGGKWPILKHLKSDAVSMTSPAYPLIIIVSAATPRNSDEINEDLVIAEQVRHTEEVRIFVADHDRLSVLQHGPDIADHVPGYMWYMIEEDVAIGSHQASYIHVPVINTEIITLAYQAFDDLDHRAFA